MSREAEVGSADYLHDCLAWCGSLMRIRYGNGHTHDLFAIEKETAGVLSRGRLTYDDVEKIRNSRIWKADKFGYWPSRSEVESVLESKEWRFQALPEGEDEAIEELLAVFHQIELVSVILRFAVPEHYGIMSPPVERVLGIGPFRRHSEKYRAYLKNLREIRDAKGFRSAAEVDMALWVLQIGVLDDDLLKRSLPGEDFESLRRGFANDSKLREIRAGNLARQFLSDDENAVCPLSRVALSEALLPTDFLLAGQIAGIELERKLRKCTRDASCDLAKIVEIHVPRLARIFPTIKPGFWKRAVKTRNWAVHHDPRLTKERVEELIQGLVEIERMTDTEVDRRTASPGA